MSMTDANGNWMCAVSGDDNSDGMPVRISTITFDENARRLMRLDDNVWPSKRTAFPWTIV